MKLFLAVILEGSGSLEQIPLVNGPSGLGRGWWEAVLWGTGAPGRENTVGGPCCLACPVRNGLVPAEIVSVPLLQPREN